MTTLQTTLRRPGAIAGIGLHSGRPMAMTLRPARAGRGIVFVRRDAPPAVRLIRADWRAVASSRLATVLGNGHGIAACTVEHVMAALRGCGVDNAVIDLDGDEVPIADGSAAPFVRLIRDAGLTPLHAPRRSIRVREPVEVCAGESRVRLEPHDGVRFTVGIDFPSRAIGRQQVSFDLDRPTFERDIAPARTFGFAEQLAELHAQGLARGGSTATAILVAGDTVLNPQGLRFADEFARHKLLDSIGDLYLAGAPLLGHYIGFKPSHALNVALLATLFAREEAWEWVDAASGEAEPRRSRPHRQAMPSALTRAAACAPRAHRPAPARAAPDCRVRTPPAR